MKHRATKHHSPNVTVTPARLVPVTGDEALATGRGNSRGSEGPEDHPPTPELPAGFPLLPGSSAADPQRLARAYERINGRPWVDTGRTFERVRNAYDLELLGRSRVIAVGTGGAAAFIEDLARAGVSDWVLIDPDEVEEVNLATQQTYRRDLGRPKVEVLAERLLDINPNATVKALQVRFEEIDDDELERILVHPVRFGVGLDRQNQRVISKPLTPDQVLIAGLSDDFAAQARVNNVALNWALPSLNAQVWLEGRGAEITFTHPTVSKACHRCILSSRYRFYLEEGNENPVTSAGTPLSSTNYLNALKFMVTMALLHHGSDHPRWGDLLERMGQRNLIQIRLDHGIGDSLGIKAFDKVFRGADQDFLLFGEPIFKPQQPENPDTGYEPCPDCGGSGNLLDAKGTFLDTRKVRS